MASSTPAFIDSSMNFPISAIRSGLLCSAAFFWSGVYKVRNFIAISPFRGWVWILAAVGRDRPESALHSRRMS